MRSLFKALCFVFFIFCLDVPIAFSGNYGAGSPGNYAELARKLLAANQPLAAELKLGEGLTYYPRAIDLYVLRGGIRVDYLNNDYGALMDYNMALSINSKSQPKVYYRKGDIFFNKGMYANAVKEYSKCLNLMPNYPKVYIKRAKAYVKLGQKEKAKVDLIKAAKIDPRYRNEIFKFWSDNHL